MSATQPTVEAALAETQQVPMSYEEYLAWDREEGLVEWVNGEAIIHMGYGM